MSDGLAWTIVVELAVIVGDRRLHLRTAAMTDHTHRPVDLPPGFRKCADCGAIEGADGVWRDVAAVNALIRAETR